MAFLNIAREVSSILACRKIEMKRNLLCDTTFSLLSLHFNVFFSFCANQKSDSENRACFCLLRRLGRASFFAFGETRKELSCCFGVYFSKKTNCVVVDGEAMFGMSVTVCVFSLAFSRVIRNLFAFFTNSDVWVFRHFVFAKDYLTATTYFPFRRLNACS